MTRMMDRLRRVGAQVPEPFGRHRPKDWLNIVAASPVVVADNVTRYFFECEQEEWGLVRDFPAIAPPMPAMWVEGRPPSTFWSSGTGRVPWPSGWPSCYGWWMASQRVPPGPEGAALVERFWEVQSRNAWGLRSLGVGPGAIEELGWIATVDVYVELPGMERILGPKVHWSFEIRKDGGISTDSNGQARILSRNVSGLDDHVFQAVTMTWLHPFLLTLTFMHCKNVQARDEVPPERLSRRWQQRGGDGTRPLVEYKVLDIEAFRRESARRGGGEAGRRQSLHTVRGHFKTYPEGSKLFGRHTGTFWWPLHAAGVAERGSVVKDYRLKDRR